MQKRKLTAFPVGGNQHTKTHRTEQNTMKRLSCRLEDGVEMIDYENMLFQAELDEAFEKIAEQAGIEYDSNEDSIPAEWGKLEIIRERQSELHHDLQYQSS